MKIIILLFISSSLFCQIYELPAEKGLKEESLKKALTYEGVKEITNNSSPEIDAFLASVGLKPGNPWCAAFRYYCLASIANGRKIPILKSGLCAAIFQDAKKRGVKVKSDYQKYDQIFWNKKGTISGHTGVIDSVLDRKGNVITLEGNTGNKNQREGDCVTKKTRNLKCLLGRLSVQGAIRLKD